MVGYYALEEKHSEPDLQHQHGSILGEISIDDDGARNSGDNRNLLSILWFLIEIIILGFTISSIFDYLGK